MKPSYLCSLFFFAAVILFSIVALTPYIVHMRILFISCLAASIVCAYGCIQVEIFNKHLSADAPLQSFSLPLPVYLSTLEVIGRFIHLKIRDHLLVRIRSNSGRYESD